MEKQAENMLIKNVDALGEKLDAMRDESARDRQALALQIANLAANGCSKAGNHDANDADLFKRMNRIEIAQAEGKGKFAILMILFGAALTWALGKIHF